MAASMKVFNLINLNKVNRFAGHLSYSRLRQFSSTLKVCKQNDSRKNEVGSQPQDERVPQVGMSEEGRVLISWHPEPTHPYEHTMPLPRSSKELTEGESVLKVQLLKREEVKYRPDGPTIPELSNIFHTTKHRWYPKGARRKAVDHIGPSDGIEDREGI